MKIIIERSGGFVALKKTVERDEASLTPEQRAAIERLFEKRPAPYSPTRSESFSYQVIIQDERGTRKLRLDEDDMPKALSALLSQ